MSFEASSSFGRYGRDDRRRRLLTDDLGETVSGTSCRASGSDSTPAKQDHYGDAAFLNQQLRLVDLVPQRLLGQFLVFAAGGAIIAGLEVGYAWMCGHAAGSPPIVSLDVAAKGSLACWFSSMLLMAAALASFIIYSVRRYRVDDYQGHYRVWAWAAALWFLASADQAASLHEWFERTMIAATGTTLVGGGDAWWFAAYLVMVGAVGSRMFLDLRPSWLATGSFSLAGIAALAAFAVRWHWIFEPSTVTAALCQSSCELAACLLLFFATTLFARHVLLDAEGQLPVCQAKPKTKRRKATKAEAKKTTESTTTASTGDTWRKFDSAQPTPPPPHQPASQPAQATATVIAASASNSSPKTAAAMPSSSPATASATGGSADHKLTKAERKALKERLLRERQARDARK